MKKLSHLLTLVILFPILIYSQDSDKKEKKEKPERQKFEMIYDINCTEVKAQDKTGTCWSFATASFFEAELIRMGKGSFDLSEMFIVRHTYPMKAEKYVRYQGMANFGQGGQAHDVFHVMEQYGHVPQSVYGGKIVDKKKHNHGELEAVLKGILDGVLKKRGGNISHLWPGVVESTLDQYLGEVPEKFEFERKEYTPKSFADMLGLKKENYIELTSFTHHPFYKGFNLEIPDNWTNDLFYNLPIDELVEVMNYALENGYSVNWDGDVSEKSFDMKKGYAVIPVEKEDDKDQDKDNEKDESEESEPEVEKEITQGMRQETFNSFATTDDHLMHIVGLSENQNGTKFYYTKNSWGEKGKYDGFLHMSEPYIRLKTIAIMVHKDAIPEVIKEKLELK